MPNYFCAKVVFTVEVGHGNQIVLESGEAATRMQFSQVQGTVQGLFCVEHLLHFR